MKKLLLCICVPLVACAMEEVGQTPRQSYETICKAIKLELKAGTLFEESAIEPAAIVEYAGKTWQFQEEEQEGYLLSNLQQLVNTSNYAEIQSEIKSVIRATMQRNRFRKFLQTDSKNELLDLHYKRSKFARHYWKQRLYGSLEPLLQYHENVKRFLKINPEPAPHVIKTGKEEMDAPKQFRVMSPQEFAQSFGEGALAEIVAAVRKNENPEMIEAIQHADAASTSLASTIESKQETTLTQKKSRSRCVMRALVIGSLAVAAIPYCLAATHHLTDYLMPANNTTLPDLAADNSTIVPDTSLLSLLSENIWHVVQHVHEYIPDLTHQLF